MEPSVAEWIAQQNQLQRLIDRSVENVKKIGRANLTPAIIRSRLNALKETCTQFRRGHLTLERVVTDAQRSSISYFADNLYEKTEDTYQTALDFLTERLEELEPVSQQSFSASSPINSTMASGSSLPHLPPIQIPPFDGTYEHWEHFRDRFSHLIIKNSDLKDFARMHYLMSCLKGSALDIVKDLSVTAENFDAAWKALTSRYDNKRRLLGLHLSSLLNLPAVSRESPSDLQALLEKVNSALKSLKNLKRTSADLWHDMVTHLICAKLDASTRKAWSLKMCDFDGLSHVDELLGFIRSRARALEECAIPATKRLSGQPSTSKISASTASPKTLPHPAATVTHRDTRSSTASSAASVGPLCPICKGSHSFRSCPQFVRGSASRRRELVRQHNRCFNCLSAHHLIRDCASKYHCRFCPTRHHSMLHTSNDESATLRVATPAAAGGAPPTAAVRSEVNSLIASASAPRTPRSVLLATAWVSVRGTSGRSMKVRALLDQGSEMTFISERTAQTLRLKRLRLPVAVSAVGGVHAGTIQHASEIIITPADAVSPAFSTTALIMQKLTSYAPRTPVDLSSFSHLCDLELADATPSGLNPIDLIIGVDLYTDVLLEGVRKGEIGQPIAQQSAFGWIISGPVSSRTAELSRDRDSARVSINHCCHSISLENALRRFWEVEELPRRSIASVADEQCEEHFRQTHSRADDGRYIVRLPFSRGPPIEIGDSRTRAHRLVESLCRRFNSQPEHAEEYRTFMTDYEQLGHMRRISRETADSNQCVYIPHHPVYRIDSLTSRIRVVFNASSVTSNGTTLNEHLLTGPKLQADLGSVILRWRNFRVVYTADITKMYRQIRVDERDLDYQRILWKPTSSNTVEDFQLLTVTYGMSCAPFLALRVVQQLAIDDENLYPRAASILRENIYVDDVLFGADDVETLRRSRDQLIALLRRGGFELRKWASNSPHLLADISAEDHGLACSSIPEPDERLKILGICWNPARDSFQFRVTLDAAEPSTKRAVLSAIARLYDPLGWVTPVVVLAKIFIQHLWKQDLTWDESVPSQLLSHWHEIYAGLTHLSGLQIPRWTGIGSSSVITELHGFSDASSDAYAAVVYLKVTTASGNVTISLLAAKSRVAPLKVISIPRLELCAAVLLSRLIAFVRETFAPQVFPSTCWTDSTIVLAWLRQSPSRWRTFVANRVSDIQTKLPDTLWRHVPSESNPADCASRGLLGADLLEHSLWWHGPSWLRESTDSWPEDRSEPHEPAVLESKISVFHSAMSDSSDDLAARFSSWPKLIRITAYLFRFASRCRKLSHDNEDKACGSGLTARECTESKRFWLRFVQSVAFASEIMSLQTQRPISAKSSIFALSPFLDSDGLLRVGGRLRNAPLPYSVRHPIILASHFIVRLLVNHVHLRSLHAGVQLTLNTLRREYWIIRARSLVKLAVYRCITCVRERATTASQFMSDLPAARVTRQTRCFDHCGLDYAGPVLVRTSGGRGVKSHKAYIAVFVCMSTRAIHLELVSDYSTSAFLAAFSRFCSRRGLPSAMYSDNGTTFVGADRELSAAYSAAIRDPNVQSTTASDNVAWHFLPPSAPHFGGLWEAGVKSVKHHLRRVLGNHTLTYEELSTLLCQIEACLNSRPIAPLYDAPDNFDALTPGHFLIGSAINTTPEESTLEINEHRLSRWQLVRHKVERMWKLWRDDYLNTLQQRKRWRKVHPSLTIGQLVIINNPLLPPCKWELARVIQCHPGPDGLTRVVTVKTAKSEYKRPITKLCALPIKSALDEE